MSADYISECPRCHEEQLREWWDPCLDVATGRYEFHVSVTCRGCEFNAEASMSAVLIEKPPVRR